jgi:hypothetical protein
LLNPACVVNVIIDSEVTSADLAASEPHVVQVLQGYFNDATLVSTTLRLTDVTSNTLESDVMNVKQFVSTETGIEPVDIFLMGEDVTTSVGVELHVSLFIVVPPAQSAAVRSVLDSAQFSSDIQAVLMASSGVVGTVVIDDVSSAMFEDLLANFMENSMSSILESGVHAKSGSDCEQGTCVDFELASQDDGDTLLSLDTYAQITTQVADLSAGLSLTSLQPSIVLHGFDVSHVHAVQGALVSQLAMDLNLETRQISVLSVDTVDVSGSDGFQFNLLFTSTSSDDSDQISTTLSGLVPADFGEPLFNSLETGLVDSSTELDIQFDFSVSSLSVFDSPNSNDMLPATEGDTPLGTVGLTITASSQVLVIPALYLSDASLDINDINSVLVVLDIPELPEALVMFDLAFSFIQTVTAESGYSNTISVVDLEQGGSRATFVIATPSAAQSYALVTAWRASPPEISSVTYEEETFELEFSGVSAGLFTESVQSLIVDDLATAAGISPSRVQVMSIENLEDLTGVMVTCRVLTPDPENIAASVNTPATNLIFVTTIEQALVNDPITSQVFSHCIISISDTMFNTHFAGPFMSAVAVLTSLPESRVEILDVIATSAFEVQVEYRVLTVDSAEATQIKNLIESTPQSVLLSSVMARFSQTQDAFERVSLSLILSGLPEMSADMFHALGGVEILHEQLQGAFDDEIDVTFIDIQEIFASTNIRTTFDLYYVDSEVAQEQLGDDAVLSQVVGNINSAFGTSKIPDVICDSITVPSSGSVSVSVSPVSVVPVATPFSLEVIDIEETPADVVGKVVLNGISLAQFSAMGTDLVTALEALVVVDGAVVQDTAQVVTSAQAAVHATVSLTGSNTTDIASFFSSSAFAAQITQALNVDSALVLHAVNMYDLSLDMFETMVKSQFESHLSTLTSSTCHVVDVSSANGVDGEVGVRVEFIVESTPSDVDGHVTTLLNLNLASAASTISTDASLKVVAGTFTLSGPSGMSADTFSSEMSTDFVVCLSSSLAVAVESVTVSDVTDVDVMGDPGIAVTANVVTMTSSSSAIQTAMASADLDTCLSNAFTSGLVSSGTPLELTSVGVELPLSFQAAPAANMLTIMPLDPSLEISSVESSELDPVVSSIENILSADNEVSASFVLEHVESSFFANNLYTDFIANIATALSVDPCSVIITSVQSSGFIETTVSCIIIEHNATRAANLVTELGTPLLLSSVSTQFVSDYTGPTHAIALDLSLSGYTLDMLDDIGGMEIFESMLSSALAIDLDTVEATAAQQVFEVPDIFEVHVSTVMLLGMADHSQVSQTLLGSHDVEDTLDNSLRLTYLAHRSAKFVVGWTMHVNQTSSQVFNQLLSTHVSEGVAEFLSLPSSRVVVASVDQSVISDSYHVSFGVLVDSYAMAELAVESIDANSSTLVSSISQTVAGSNVSVVELSIELSGPTLTTDIFNVVQEEFAAVVSSVIGEVPSVYDLNEDAGSVTVSMHFVSDDAANTLVTAQAEDTVNAITAAMATALQDGIFDPNDGLTSSVHVSGDSPAPPLEMQAAVPTLTHFSTPATVEVIHPATISRVEMTSSFQSVQSLTPQAEQVGSVSFELVFESLAPHVFSDHVDVALVQSVVSITSVEPSRVFIAQVESQGLDLVVIVNILFTDDSDMASIVNVLSQPSVRETLQSEVEMHLPSTQLLSFQSVLNVSPNLLTTAVLSSLVEGIETDFTDSVAGVSVAHDGYRSMVGVETSVLTSNVLSANDLTSIQQSLTSTLSAELPLGIKTSFSASVYHVTSSVFSSSEFVTAVADITGAAESDIVVGKVTNFLEADSVGVVVDCDILSSTEAEGLTIVTNLLSTDFSSESPLTSVGEIGLLVQVSATDMNSSLFQSEMAGSYEAILAEQLQLQVDQVAVMSVTDTDADILELQVAVYVDPTQVHLVHAVATSSNIHQSVCGQLTEEEQVTLVNESDVIVIAVNSSSEPSDISVLSTSVFVNDEGDVDGVLRVSGATAGIFSTLYQSVFVDTILEPLGSGASVSISQLSNGVAGDMSTYVDVSFTVGVSSDVQAVLAESVLSSDQFLPNLISAFTALAQVNQVSALLTLNVTSSSVVDFDDDEVQSHIISTVASVVGVSAMDVVVYPSDVALEGGVIICQTGDASALAALVTSAELSDVLTSALSTPPLSVSASVTASATSPVTDVIPVTLSVATHARQVPAAAADIQVTDVQTSTGSIVWSVSAFQDIVVGDDTSATCLVTGITQDFFDSHLETSFQAKLAEALGVVELTVSVTSMAVSTPSRLSVPVSIVVSGADVSTLLAGADFETNLQSAVALDVDGEPTLPTDFVIADLQVVGISPGVFETVQVPTFASIVTDTSATEVELSAISETCDDDLTCSLSLSLRLLTTSGAVTSVNDAVDLDSMAIALRDAAPASLDTFVYITYQAVGLTSSSVESASSYVESSFATQLTLPTNQVQVILMHWSSDNNRSFMTVRCAVESASASTVSTALSDPATATGVATIVSSGLDSGLKKVLITATTSVSGVSLLDEQVFVSALSNYTSLPSDKMFVTSLSNGVNSVSVSFTISIEGDATGVVGLLEDMSGLGPILTSSLQQSIIDPVDSVGVTVGNVTVNSTDNNFDITYVTPVLVETSEMSVVVNLVNSWSEQDLPTITLDSITQDPTTNEVVGLAISLSLVDATYYVGLEPVIKSQLASDMSVDVSAVTVTSTNTSQFMTITLEIQILTDSPTTSSNLVASWTSDSLLQAITDHMQGDSSAPIHKVQAELLLSGVSSLWHSHVWQVMLSQVSTLTSVDSSRIQVVPSSMSLSTSVLDDTVLTTNLVVEVYCSTDDDVAAVLSSLSAATSDLMVAVDEEMATLVLPAKSYATFTLSIVNHHASSISDTDMISFMAQAASVAEEHVFVSIKDMAGPSASLEVYVEFPGIDHIESFVVDPEELTSVLTSDTFYSVSGSLVLSGFSSPVTPAARATIESQISSSLSFAHRLSSVSVESNNTYTVTVELVSAVDTQANVDAWVLELDSLDLATQMQAQLQTAILSDPLSCELLSVCLDSSSPILASVLTGLPETFDNSLSSVGGVVSEVMSVTVASVAEPFVSYSSITSDMSSNCVSSPLTFDVIDVGSNVGTTTTFSTGILSGVVFDRIDVEVSSIIPSGDITILGVESGDVASSTLQLTVTGLQTTTSTINIDGVALSGFIVNQSNIDMTVDTPAISVGSLAPVVVTNTEVNDRASLDLQLSPGTVATSTAPQLDLQATAASEASVSQSSLVLGSNEVYAVIGLLKLSVPFSDWTDLHTNSLMLLIENVTSVEAQYIAISTESAFKKQAATRAIYEITIPDNYYITAVQVRDTLKISIQTNFFDRLRAGPNFANDMDTVAEFGPVIDGIVPPVEPVDPVDSVNETDNATDNETDNNTNGTVDTPVDDPKSGGSDELLPVFAWGLIGGACAFFALIAAIFLKKKRDEERWEKKRQQNKRDLHHTSRAESFFTSETLLSRFDSFHNSHGSPDNKVKRTTTGTSEVIELPVLSENNEPRSNRSGRSSRSIRRKSSSQQELLSDRANPIIAYGGKPNNSSSTSIGVTTASEYEAESPAAIDKTATLLDDNSSVGSSVRSPPMKDSLAVDILGLVDKDQDGDDTSQS